MVATPSELLLPIDDGTPSARLNIQDFSPPGGNAFLVYNGFVFDDIWDLLYGSGPPADVFADRSIPVTDDLVIATFVPEPASAITASLGLLGLVVLRRRS